MLSIQIFPQSGMEPGGHPPFPIPMIMLQILEHHQEDLKLSSSQKAEILNQIQSFEKRLVQTHNQINLYRLELKNQMIFNQKRNYEKIGLLLKKISGNRDLLFVEGLKTEDAIQHMLNSEQLSILRNFIRDHREKNQHFSPPQKMRPPDHSFWPPEF
jgi:hypothetical protein